MKFTQIMIERTHCFGRCPVYRAVVSNTGEVHYSGEDYVEKHGNHSWRIAPEAVKALEQLIDRTGYLDLAGDYVDGESTCAGFCNTSATRLDGTVKTVRHYLGDFGAQAQLYAFEDGVDALAGIRAYTRGA